MKRVKLIAMDMDGTLLSSDHATIPAGNVDAIRRAHEAGIVMVINTGRMVEDASDFIRRYNLPCMIVAGNGARASTGPMPESEWVYRCSLKPQDAHKALDILLASGLMVNGFEDGIVHSAGGKAGGKYHLVSRGLIEDRYGEATIREAADRGILKFFAIGDGFAGDLYDPRIEPTRNQLIKALPHLLISSSGPGNVEVTSPEAGKGTTLARLASQLGIKREEVMAVGDEGNDLNMLEYAYHSVAMENACEAVKRICLYETGSNDDCGVAQIIDRVLAAKGVC